VILGKARFTVLTPELIRMEWAADGKFEDHASFMFINRRSAVDTIAQGFRLRVDEAIKHIGNNPPPDLDAQKQHRLDAMSQAQKLLSEAGK
jgi:hypothetical protein